MHEGLPAATVGRAWTDDYPRAFHRRLVEVDDRMAGRPGEHRAARLVAEALDDAGARDVTVDAFDVAAWRRGEAALGVVEPVERSFPAIALPYAPAGDLRAPLIDVGHGTPEEIDAADVSGGIAVASTDTPPGDGRFLHRMEKYGHAAAAGAVGFVFRNHVPGQLPPTGSLAFGAEAAIPGVGVSKETGDWLVEYADRDGAVSLHVDAATEPGASHNAHGVLGPDTDEEVVVLAHHDAHDVGEGALDNGCGVAVAVTAARLLADADLDTRVRVAGVGAEEVGLRGAEALADDLALDDVRAVVNVDGAGRNRTLRAITHGSWAVEETVTAVADAADHPVAVETDVHPFSDHWPFLRRGVPALQLHSESETRGRGWTHTHADTRDKVDVRDIRAHGILTAMLVVALANRDRPPRIDEQDVAGRLDAQGMATGMEAAGIWPDGW